MKWEKISQEKVTIQSYVTLRHEWPRVTQSLLPSRHKAQGHRVINGFMSSMYFDSEEEARKWSDAIHPDVIVETASSIARKVHAGEFRRDGVTPYISHPEAVAKSLEGENSYVVATAWLHDGLEHGKLSVNQLKEEHVPPQVIAAVILLTKESDETYEEYIQAVAKNSVARKVKIADIRHNLSDAPTERQVAKYTKALEILGAEETTQHDKLQAPRPCSAKVAAELCRLLVYYRSYMPYCLGTSEEVYAKTQEAIFADEGIAAYCRETGYEPEPKPSSTFLR